MNKMPRSMFCFCHLTLVAGCWLQDPLTFGIDSQHQQQISLCSQDQQTQHRPIQQGAEAMGNNREP
jgi:hypothetical protein